MQDLNPNIEQSHQQKDFLPKIFNIFKKNFFSSLLIILSVAALEFASEYLVLQIVPGILALFLVIALKSFLYGFLSFYITYEASTIEHPMRSFAQAFWTSRGNIWGFVIGSLVLHLLMAVGGLGLLLGMNIKKILSGNNGLLVNEMAQSSSSLTILIGMFWVLLMAYYAVKLSSYVYLIPFACRQRASKLGELVQIVKDFKNNDLRRNEFLKMTFVPIIVIFSIITLVGIQYQSPTPLSTENMKKVLSSLLPVQLISLGLSLIYIVWLTSAVEAVKLKVTKSIDQLLSGQEKTQD